MNYWHKQSVDQPLFPDLAWEKPERKDQAGRLLIVGGNLHGFSAVAKADQTAKEHGVGYTRILMPDALQRTLAPLWTDAIFCPSTPSGSFGKDARDLVLQNALWADGILLPGDFGRNSETAILLDEIVRSMNSPIVITKDALDYYLERPLTIFDKPNAIIVASFSQAQKLLARAGSKDPLIYNMPLASLVGTLERFSNEHPSALVTKTDTHIIVALNGEVATSKLEDAKDIWRVEIASKIAVSLLHHPTKPFEAIVSSVL